MVTTRSTPQSQQQRDHFEITALISLDALKGDGLNFDILDFPFILKAGVLTIKDARTSGPSLGLTGSGTADLRGKALDVEGTVVPAYAVNAVLGNIPIIGPMLTGPEKGSGIFAATYTMKGKGEKVKRTVNPLSALAPHRRRPSRRRSAAARAC